MPIKTFKFYDPFLWWILLYRIICVTYADGCIGQRGCEITCSGIYSANWKEQIMAIAEEQNCENLNRLYISDAKGFSDKTLPADWLDESTKNGINKLEFKSCKFDKIEPGALKIKQLQILTFSACDITYFTRESFQDLTWLQTFTLAEYVYEEITVEAKIFQDIPALSTLAIESCKLNGQLLDNITGVSGSITHLQSIIVQRSNLNHLPGMMISKAKSIRGLILQYNSIETIDKDAFWSSNIQTIDLSYNALTTLYTDTFKYISHDQYMNRTIKLQGNSWKCDCDLKWLYDLYLSRNKVFVDPEPVCDDMKTFSEADFECDGEVTSTVTTDSSSIPTVTTSTSTSNTTSTSTTTVPPDDTNNYLTVQCLDGQEQETQTKYETSIREYLTTIEMNITTTEEKLIRMNIYNLDEDPKIEIEFIGNLTNITLLYVDIFKDSAPSCLKNLPQSLFLCDVERNRTYTMCLLSEGETKVPPRSCFGFKVPPDWEERSWIANKSKYLTIGLVAASLLLCGIVSGVVMFFVIRFNPSLIDGNENVIIVKRKLGSESEPDCNFERPEYSEPFVMTGQSGYMTPAMPQYEKINYYSRRMGSIYGNNSSSYIRPGFGEPMSRAPLQKVNEEKMESYNASAPLPSIPRADTGIKEKMYY